MTFPPKASHRLIARDRSASVSLDIIIPVYNEEEIVDLIVERLRSVFSPEACAAEGLKRVRYLFVDDGSRDRSAQMLMGHIQAGFPAQLIRLSRNFGHQCAVTAGLDYADADVVAVIDADLQDPPEILYGMLSRWRDGADVVYGERRKRKEHLVKRAAYWGFYRLLAVLSEIAIPLDSGDFCLMDRCVVEQMRQLPEKLRFIRGLRSWVGFHQEGFPYERHGRAAGEPKYTWGRLYNLATNGIASMSIRPLKLLQLITFVFFVFSSVIAIMLLLVLTGGSHWDVPASVLGLYLLGTFSAAVQAFSVYLLGAYIGRTYQEVKGRPAYVVMEVVEAPPLE